MKKLLITLTGILILGSTVRSQTPEADRIRAKTSDIIIQPILHGSLILEWNDEVIYVDPYGGAKPYEGQKNPSIVLITDIHHDHLNTETLDVLELQDATFVAPQAVADLLPEKYQSRLIILQNGESGKIKDIAVTALPMYNLPESAEAPHTKGRGNGYVVELGGKKIYLSGDTEDIPEMRALKGIDAAFVCMNLPYTMTVDQAASAVLDFKPKVVYPYHYRGKDGLSDVESFKKQVNAGNEKIEVRLKNWYPEF